MIFSNNNPVNALVARRRYCEKFTCYIMIIVLCTFDIAAFEFLELHTNCVSGMVMATDQQYSCNFVTLQFGKTKKICTWEKSSFVMCD